MITSGEWRVPHNLVGDHADANGRVVLRGRDLVADCRNDALPELEQRGNAKAAAAVPHLIDALQAAERFIGSQKGKQAALAYRRVCDALKWAGATIKPDDDDEEESE